MSKKAKPKAKSKEKAKAKKQNHDGHGKEEVVAVENLDAKQTDASQGASSARR